MLLPVMLPQFPPVPPDGVTPLKRVVRLYDCPRNFTLHMRTARPLRVVNLCILIVFIIVSILLADLEGFEPSILGSEPSALPLHHRSILNLGRPHHTLALKLVDSLLSYARNTNTLYTQSRLGSQNL